MKVFVKLKNGDSAEIPNATYVFKQHSDIDGEPAFLIFKNSDSRFSGYFFKDEVAGIWEQV